MELNGKSILVTGGAGFIGSHLIDRLIQESPSNLVAIDNLFLGKRENLADAFAQFPKLKFYEETICNMDRMREILTREKIDVVFDLATIPLPCSLEKPYWSADEIYRMMLVLCELCREGLFKTLLHCSTSEVFGTAVYVPMDEDHPLKVETPYAAAKAGADLLLRSYHETFGIDTVIVRPFNNYGPRQNEKSYAGVIPLTIRRILAAETPLIFGDGTQTRDFIYVTDTAEGFVAAVKEERLRGRSVNIASGEELSVNRLIELISTSLGYTGKPKHGPKRPADVLRHMADVKLAKEVLRFKPKVSVEDGIQRTVDWYKKTLPPVR